MSAEKLIGDALAMAQENKRLAALIVELRAALLHAGRMCRDVHHQPPHDLHESDEPCPVEARIKSVLEKSKDAK